MLLCYFIFGFVSVVLRLNSYYMDPVIISVYVQLCYSGLYGL
jgi:hypothetical protein